MVSYTHALRVHLTYFAFSQTIMKWCVLYLIFNVFYGSRVFPLVYVSNVSKHVILSVRGLGT